MPTSSPRMKTRSSRSISSHSPWRIASSKVIAAIVCLLSISKSQHDAAANQRVVLTLFKQREGEGRRDGVVIANLAAQADVRRPLHVNAAAKAVSDVDLGVAGDGLAINQRVAWAEPRQADATDQIR